MSRGAPPFGLAEAGCGHKHQNRRLGTRFRPSDDSCRDGAHRHQHAEEMPEELRKSGRVTELVVARVSSCYWKGARAQKRTHRGFFVSRPRRNPRAPSPRGWRDWYQLQIWRNIRAVHLRKEPLCRECLGRGEHTLASEVDHVTPHNGDWNQFILGAKQSLCSACHRAKSARAHRKSQGGFDEHGEPLNADHWWHQRG